MNEILTKIAVEAKVEHCISHVRLQAFAELIVKECIEVIACNAHVSGFSLGDIVEEHFGVNNATN